MLRKKGAKKSTKGGDKAEKEETPKESVKKGKDKGDKEEKGAKDSTKDKKDKGDKGKEGDRPVGLGRYRFGRVVPNPSQGLSLFVWKSARSCRARPPSNRVVSEASVCTALAY